MFCYTFLSAVLQSYLLFHHARRKVTQAAFRRKTYVCTCLMRQRSHLPLQASLLFPDLDTAEHKAEPSSKNAYFLRKLRTATGKYRRYLGSPLRYAGGKSWAVGYILSYMPPVKKVVSPFLGGASVEIAIANEIGIPVEGFDIFELLINYWYHQLNNPLGLYEILASLSPNKETYAQIKQKLYEHWTGKTQLEPLTLAAYYYFNHNLSYGPGFLGWMSSVYANEGVYRRMIEYVKSFRAPLLSVGTSSFEVVIRDHPEDFLYCDPPYYLGEDSDVFRGLYPQRNFPIHHHGFNHALLRDLLHSHKRGFILSYNDAPTIREWYKDFTIVELDVHYTMGQGETRVGQNRERKQMGHIKRRKELLIIKK